jgi:hypothetical protein
MDHKTFLVKLRGAVDFAIASKFMISISFFWTPVAIWLACSCCKTWRVGPNYSWTFPGRSMMKRVEQYCTPRIEIAGCLPLAL